MQLYKHQRGDPGFVNGRTVPNVVPWGRAKSQKSLKRNERLGIICGVFASTLQWFAQTFRLRLPLHGSKSLKFGLYFRHQSSLTHRDFKTEELVGYLILPSWVTMIELRSASDTSPTTPPFTGGGQIFRNLA